MLKFSFFWRNVILFFILLSCGGWGFLVHRTVGQLATYELPGRMRPFFYKNREFIQQEIIEPDLRRSRDPSEAPKHFIDLEPYGDSSAWKMPSLWEEASRKYGKDSLFRYGYVPYAVLMEKERLTQAFREGSRDSILIFASDIAHYISDAHVPLHTTMNYDGQLSGQNGIHNLWETLVPEIELPNYMLYGGHHASYLDNPAGAIWDAVRGGHAMLGALLDAEKETARLFPDSSKYRSEWRNGKRYLGYTAAFAGTYSKKLGTTVNDQLLRSADLTADFWYTCWKDAGAPDLNSLLAKQWTSEDRKSLKRQLREFRKNRLVQEKMLWATESRKQPGQ